MAAEMTGQFSLTYTDTEYEISLGDRYDIFDFECGGELDDDDPDLWFSIGHVNDNSGDPYQRTRTEASNGSNHTQGWMTDRCIRLKRWNGSYFETLLEASYVENTATSIILNVSVANADYPVWFSARKA